MSRHDAGASVPLQKGNAEMYCELGLMIYWEQGVCCDAAFDVPVMPE